MNTEQLKQIFKHQLTSGSDYEPNGQLTYILFEEHQSPRTLTYADTEWDKIAETLQGFVHEGYRDRTPTFIKPIEHIV